MYLNLGEYSCTHRVVFLFAWDRKSESDGKRQQQRRLKDRPRKEYQRGDEAIIKDETEPGVGAVKRHRDTGRAGSYQGAVRIRSRRIWDRACSFTLPEEYIQVLWSQTVSPNPDIFLTRQCFAFLFKHRVLEMHFIYFLLRDEHLSLLYPSCKQVAALHFKH